MKRIHWISRMGLAALLALIVLAGCGPASGAQGTVEIVGVTMTPLSATLPPGTAYPAQAEPQSAQTPYPAREETPTAQQPAANPAYPPMDNPPTPFPGAPAPRPAPVDPLPSDAVLRLTRSGGIAGVHETWTVYTGGQVQVSRKPGQPAEPAGQLDPAQVQTLLTELERLGFFDLQPAYGPKNLCCDLFTTTLQVRSGERQHAVTVMEGQSDDTPAALLKAMETIQALLQSAR